LRQRDCETFIKQTKKEWKNRKEREKKVRTIHTSLKTFSIFFALLTHTHCFTDTQKHRPQTQTPVLMAGIHEASYDGDLAEVKRLVEEEGVNPEAPDSNYHNCVPLHYAAFNGRENVVTYLALTCGAEVDRVDDDNRTSLHYASQENHASCAQLLLRYGADPNITNIQYGDTPIMTCAFYGQLASMNALLQDGRCDLEIKRPATGSKAILLAADQKKWDCVELLLTYHASPIAKRNIGWNLHDYATEYQAPSTTLRLIETAIFERERPRLLHRARRINEAQHNPVTDGPAFLRQRADNNLPLPRVELSQRLLTAGPGNAGENECLTVRRAVVQYVVGMKGDGSVGGGMLKEHVVELMDMLLPVWDAERTEEEEEEEGGNHVMGV
jgi:ankyrin repeat protein